MNIQLIFLSSYLLSSLHIWYDGRKIDNGPQYPASRGAKNLRGGLGLYC